MGFDKYRRLGDYHWKWFASYPRYRHHVFRVRIQRRVKAGITRILGPC